MKTGCSACCENPAKAVCGLRGFAEAELNRREVYRALDHEMAILQSFGFTMDLLEDQRGFVETRLLFQQMSVGQFVVPMDFRPGTRPRRRVLSRKALQAVDACSSFVSMAVMQVEPRLFGDGGRRQPSPASGRTLVFGSLQDRVSALEVHPRGGHPGQPGSELPARPAHGHGLPLSVPWVGRASRWGSDRPVSDSSRVPRAHANRTVDIQARNSLLAVLDHLMRWRSG